MSGPLEQFEALAATTLDDVERIECDVPTFIEGLSMIIARLEDARDAAVECHKATGS